MRILYLDIDSLRPDHLGCYGYARATSPVIDTLAEHGVRFDNCFVSDAPCLPSRTAFSQGRFGIKNGVVNHGGVAAELRSLGSERGHNVRPGFETLFRCLQKAGYATASISSFPARHGAWWFLAGLDEWHNPRGSGNENADEVNAKAVPWLQANAESDDWFLHVNYWDAHTLYSTPDSYGNPFADDPAPSWFTEELRKKQWDGYGTFSAQDGIAHWLGRHPEAQRSGVPSSIASMDDFKAWIDGYDTGIRYADEHVGHLLEVLDQKGVLDETMIVVTADHGENQGELNVFGDHQTADLITSRVPMIVRAPQLLPAGQARKAFHYQFDVGATLLELLGIEVPSGWDARSFAPSLQAGDDVGRDHLVLGQMAWSCQRSVRFKEWILLRTYHAGLKDLAEVLLFDAENDRHEQHDLAAARPEVVNEGLALLHEWQMEALTTSETGPIDPMQTVLREGGPVYARGLLEPYLERLRNTDRAEPAERLERVAKSGR